MMPDCEACRPLLTAWIEEALDDPPEHLATCANCRAAVEQERRIRGIIRTAAPVRIAPAPSAPAPWWLPLAAAVLIAVILNTLSESPPAEAPAPADIPLADALKQCRPLRLASIRIVAAPRPAPPPPWILKMMEKSP